MPQPTATEPLIEPVVETATGVQRIIVQGMTCAHCAATLTRALEHLKGVKVTDISYATGDVQYATSGALPTQSELRKAVQGAGYTLVVGKEGFSKAEDAHTRRSLILFWWSFAWSLPVVLTHWLGYMHEPWAIWVVFTCATVLQPTSAITYYIGAIKSLRRREANMDVLIGIGVAAGYTYAVLATFLPERFPGGGMEFFEAATLLIAFVRLGKWVESRARRNASRALSLLMELTPKKVRRLQADGTSTDISVTDVVLNDRLVLLPGEVLAVDAEIVEGEGHFDEAVVTGESMPVQRTKGQRVVAGATLVDARLVVEARSTGDDSTIAKITTMVRDAQNSKAPIQRLADRISSIFVPGVVTIAVMSGLYWGIFTDVGTSQVLHHVIGVLVIACPCALGLAVPAAIMLGSSACLKRGVLVKNGAALEALSKIDVVAFDKTGTLTAGKPRVSRVHPNIDEPEALSALLRLTSASTHPIASAIRQWCTSKADVGQPPQSGDVFEIGGKGMVASGEGQTWALGNALLMSEFEVEIREDPEASGSISHLAHNGELVATFVIEDDARPEAADVIRYFHDRQIRTVMISGDRRANAEAVARVLGIDEVHAQIRPEGKLEFLEQLRRDGHRVAMVGDGINDAPSLAKADVGISMGNASDISKESGDIVLMHGGLNGLPTAVELARMTRRGIHRNLFLSLIYNMVGIPLAAGVAALFVPSMVIPASYASLAMVMSDLSVAAGSFLLAAELRRSKVGKAF